VEGEAQVAAHILRMPAMDTMETAEREAVAAILAAPLHRLLGLRLIDERDPAAGVEIDVGPAALNPSGVLHGTVAPLLIDVACFLAVRPRLPAGGHAVTANTACSLLAAVPPGRTVRARGRVDRCGRTLAYLSATVHDGDRLVATGQLVKAIVPPRD
jgi:uncharacterized protein (TIGR00369 family)